MQKLCHCGNKHLAKGLCSKHYNESKRKDNPGWNSRYSKAWRQNNPEKIKASNATRRRRHGGYSSKATRDMVLELLEQQKECPACFCEFSLQNIATLDHKTPLARGGLHEIDNLHLLCFSCNARKGTKTWEEFNEQIKSG